MEIWRYIPQSSAFRRRHLAVPVGPLDADLPLAEIDVSPLERDHLAAPKARLNAYLPHGVDIDRSTGVIWAALNSGQFGSFDRRKCKGPLNGPTATGQHCPEGWTLFTMPGPNFKGVDETQSATSDAYYLNWVDWFDTAGLGKNVPIATGTNSDSLIALVKDGFITMRVPYPMGFHPRGLDGRIDDPKAGWKGRGLWSAYSEQATWHIEGGKGTLPKVVHMQIRPDPLAH
jgi:hypothetical protein